MAKILYASSALSILRNLDKAQESISKLKAAGINGMADFYIEQARTELLRVVVEDVIAETVRADDPGLPVVEPDPEFIEPAPVDYDRPVAPVSNF